MKKIVCGLLLSAIGLISPTTFGAEQSPAQKLFQRLVGIPSAPNAPLLFRMQQLLDARKPQEAALLAMTDRHFYSVRIRNFAAPMTNKEESPAETFNDMQAMIMGVVRDDLDARLLLTGNFRYQGYPSLGLPAVTKENNAHYAEFESRSQDYWKDLMKVNTQWTAEDPAAGALTTRAWAVAHYNAGTNRRAFEYAMQVFLCVSKEQWKDRNLPDSYVRRDVDRNVGGNPATYQNHCRNCHSVMDAMAGAFARVDLQNNALVFLKDKVADKYNQNAEVWPDGYITVDDSWTNQAIYNHNEALGWRGKLSGEGIKEFGEMLANSKGFSQCMTKRVFKETCHRALTQEDQPTIEAIAEGFEQNNYKLKGLFAAVATHKFCFDLQTGGTNNVQSDGLSSSSTRRPKRRGAGCPYRP